MLHWHGFGRMLPPRILFADGNNGKRATGGWMCGSICFWQTKRIMRFSAYWWVAEGLVLFVFGRRNALWGFSPTSGWLDLAMFVIGRSCDELWGVKWPLHKRWRNSAFMWFSMLHIEYYIIANCFSYIVVISITCFIFKKILLSLDTDLLEEVIGNYGKWEWSALK